MSKFTLTRFSKGFIEMMAKEKVADKNTIRDHDICKARESGSTINQISIKFCMHRTSIIDILNKYKK